MDENKKQQIISELDIAIKKLNSFIAEYDSNNPNPIDYFKSNISHLQLINNNFFDEYSKIANEYSSKMLGKYDETVYPLILNALVNCRKIVGEFDENVTNGLTKVKISTLDINYLKDNLFILIELKSVIS